MRGDLEPSAVIWWYFQVYLFDQRGFFSRINMLTFERSAR
jgi:hypothetical protein